MLRPLGEESDFQQRCPKEALDGGFPCPERFQLVKMEPAKAWLEQEAGPLPQLPARNWA